MAKHNIGIFGDTGMVGQEIGRILEGHDQVSIEFVQNSKRSIGRLKNCNLVFLATKDAESMKYALQARDLGKKVIDMSGAFRLPRETFEQGYGIEHTAPLLIQDSVYGLPAYFRDEIAGAHLVANPGCYATSVVLALKPLHGLLREDQKISIVSTSGNSGARKGVEAESNEVTYNYGTKHKHVPEMALYSGFDLDFTPIVLRSVFRGINTNIRAELSDKLKELSDDEAAKILTGRTEECYVPEDLVFVVQDNEEQQFGTKDVNRTHKLLLKIRVDHGFAYLNSLVDNMGKGAASQAVENMNIMLGLPRLYAIGRTYSTT